MYVNTAQTRKIRLWNVHAAWLINLFGGTQLHSACSVICPPKTLKFGGILYDIRTANWRRPFLLYWYGCLIVGERVMYCKSILYSPKLTYASWTPYGLDTKDDPREEA